MDENQINCEIKPGEELQLGDPRLTKCKFLPGSSFYISSTDQDDAQDITDTDTSGPNQMGTQGAVMPAPIAQVAAPQVAAQPLAATPVAAAPAPAPAAAPALGIPGVAQVGQQPVATQASVAQQPVDPAAQLSQLAAGGNISPMTIVLGGLMVLGGGTAWKFYSQKSKQGFEIKMQELENQKNGNEEQKKQCQAAAVACGASTASLTARLEDISRQISQMKDTMESLSKKVAQAEETSLKAGKMGSGLEDLEERLEATEKKLKRLSKRDSE